MESRLLLILVFLSVSLIMPAQKKPSDSEMLKEIQSNDCYIYGVGQAETIEDASQKALADLVSKITTDVESNYNYLLTSQQNNDEYSTNVDVKNVVKTYSRLTLHNAQQIIVPAKKKDKVMTVYRYITTDDLRAMYNQRGEKARHYVNIARRAAKSGEPGKALQNYSWALALLMSYPDGNTLQLDDDDFNKQYAYSWIPARMKELLRKVTIGVSGVHADCGDDETAIDLTVCFDGNPASDLTITFSVASDSCRWSETLTPANGKIPLYVPADINTKKLVANVRCNNKLEASVDPDVAAVLGILDYINFSEAERRLGRQISETAPAQARQSQSDLASNQRRADRQPVEPTRPAHSADDDSPPGDVSRSGPSRPVAASTPASKPKPSGGPLYSYKGETSAGQPDGEGVMTFNRDGVFDGITVQEGDYMQGFFSLGHLYMVDHYDSNGNLKKSNISGGM